MELKKYQKTVLADLDDFLVHLNKSPSMTNAFNDYWRDRQIRVGTGTRSLKAFREIIKGVPSVCLKVPTAGGKTLLGVHGIHRYFQARPASPKVVVWLVPSLTILDQTIKNFRNPEHPYRMKLDALFQGRVQILSKDEALSGTGFSPEAVRSLLSVIVLSFDSFRAQNKEGRKVYQENGNLSTFANLYTINKAIANADPTSLAQVLNTLTPMIVVDESHNAGSALSIDMLENLNPGFILELTATPRDTSNIISYVDALALKKEQMVKLPVVVYNNHDSTEVIANAIALRENLQRLADEEEASGGSYIRPIVLFQAEPKSKDDTLTFSKLKDKLVDFGIPKESIAIKTADVNELKNITLEDRACPIKYIITVNALKEGWDCPFAYILATVANRTSPVDVEQILGRILRQPYVRSHKKAMLNMSYVLTSSSAFLDTLDNIVSGLNHAGFSKNDYRIKDGQTIEQTQETPPPAKATRELAMADVIDSITPPTPNTAEQNAAQVVADIENIALESEAAMNEVIEQSKENPSLAVPFDLQGAYDMYEIKPQYREKAASISIPQFFEDIDAGLFNDGDESRKIITKSSFLKDFKLSRQAVNLSMDGTSAEAYSVDLASYELGESTPEYTRLATKELEAFAKFLNTLSPKDQQRELFAKIYPQLSRFDHVSDAELKEYVLKVFSALNPDQLETVKQNPYIFASKLKLQIDQLSAAYGQTQFDRAISANRIYAYESWTFPKTIGPLDTKAGLPKSLYLEEDKPNNFELRVINEVANLDNILFWHRNIERKGFWLNGWINHFPDFIIVTTRGNIILMETKGDDRDNSDSEQKLKLGKAWQAAAGRNYKYFMVFDQKLIDGALKMDDFMGVIKEL
ncbi:DEAD/DEAH box helicase family protein [Treponema zuelzerae]|uniref:DEAD/DEAH box helicase family protein n=1 Tax=Teretinema zuelzerae TaxID=156 RepID=A0AAE3EI65_9SPIR|nr:DEAD/DEAH box helicase family protein [Teretinema zuelzerae]MCD1655179.1 DEAD/DEAH box helicase family protein [Teretinema zuelzerae]